MPTAAAAVHEAPLYTREKESLLCTGSPSVLRQPQFIAVAVHEPQYTRDKKYLVYSCHSTRAAVHELNYILACVLRQPQSSLLRRRSLPWLVNFSLPQRGNWSHFIRSLVLVKNFALFFAYKEQCFVLIYFLAVRLLKYDLSDILSTARM